MAGVSPLAPSKGPSLKIVHHLRNLDDSQTKWKYLNALRVARCDALRFVSSRELGRMGRRGRYEVEWSLL